MSCISPNSVPIVNIAENLESYQFPANTSNEFVSSTEINSGLTLFHLQKRRFSSVSITGQPEIQPEHETVDGNVDELSPSGVPTSIQTPPRNRKYSILNSPTSSAFVSPL